MRRQASRFVAVIALASASAFAQAPLPTPQTQGGVTFLDGGAGDEEVQFIRQSMKDDSLALAFARGSSPSAEYVASVAVTIQDTKGRTVFASPSAGPYLLVKLPAGTYSVVASDHDETRTRPVTVGRAPGSLITFAWT